MFRTVLWLLWSGFQLRFPSNICCVNISISSSSVTYSQNLLFCVLLNNNFSLMLIVTQAKKTNFGLQCIIWIISSRHPSFSNFLKVHKFYRKTMVTFLFWFTDNIPAWLLLVSVMYLCGCLLCQFVVSAVIMCRVMYEFVMVNKSCQSEIDQEWRVIPYKCGSI